VSGDSCAGRQDLERNSRVLCESFEVDEEGDTKKTEDEGNEYTRGAPRVSDTTPRKTDDCRG
jgi:hypothetical protein